MKNQNPSPFEPKANEVIQLFEEKFFVQPHPAAAPDTYTAFAAEGRRARVYQLKNQAGQKFALKVFKKKYRDSSLESSSRHLEQLQDFEGMTAAKRRVILPSHPIAKSYRNLDYAMLMPWISGKTWFDLLLEAQQRKHFLHQATALHLCSRFLKVMSGLESKGIAHTDISAGNVMVEIDMLDVQLLDLEDLYLPGISSPPLHNQNTGSKGYQHCTAKSLWCEEGDRYASAVLAAEIIVLSNRELAMKATDEGYFIDHCQTETGREKFNEAETWLKQVAPEFAKMFRHSWYSSTIKECPRIEYLYQALKQSIDKTPFPEGQGLVGFSQSINLAAASGQPKANTRETEVAAQPWVWEKFNPVMWEGGTQPASRPHVTLASQPQAANTPIAAPVESESGSQMFSSAVERNSKNTVLKIFFWLLIVALAVLLLYWLIR